MISKYQINQVLPKKQKCLQINFFKKNKKIGEGAYSIVYKVIRQTDQQQYALKKVNLQALSQKEIEYALNEVRILASIRSNYIIGYKEAFIDRHQNCLCIVMEYSNNGDLLQKIIENQKKGLKFTEDQIWNIFIQIVKALKTLHELKIFHRDLKSANIFLNKDETIKLGDMNVSKVAKKGLLYTQTGTPYYASPEIWKDQPYDEKSDIWSLGCVLYEIVTLNPPFKAQDMDDLYQKVIKGSYQKIKNNNYSQDLINIINLLLQVNPYIRPRADQILNLPFIFKRIQDKNLLESDVDTVLLKTIKIPKNINYLNDKLPKPNYFTNNIIKNQKENFIRTNSMVYSLPKIKSQRFQSFDGMKIAKNSSQQDVQENQKKIHKVSHSQGKKYVIQNSPINNKQKNKENNSFYEDKRQQHNKKNKKYYFYQGQDCQMQQKILIYFQQKSINWKKIQK
ncbi:protein kinase domain protein [Ichthyophthirius multifiliis]|uniref:non-specific serine/threonine protein kinase n=1 Tax=Ichthyophthirius multifiliis TaxID=5932 RepID=G0QVA8_ICHMU|nr:protein kinase domain protein [Ichthyophthirius multifiliis]EGR30852.1 protein kinase domain protein [Ichthyophthirius multifiliis]|eukprot:XP_004032439.1 protein kinase domain protein [Ichthyophthirius multifiliis]